MNEQANKDIQALDDYMQVEVKVDTHPSKNNKKKRRDQSTHSLTNKSAKSDKSNTSKPSKVESPKFSPKNTRNAGNSIFKTFQTSNHGRKKVRNDFIPEQLKNPKNQIRVNKRDNEVDKLLKKSKELKQKRDESKKRNNVVNVKHVKGWSIG